MAFAPDYESSGLFYVFYTSSNDPGTGEDETGDLKIAEFDSDESPMDHNGGQLQFGPDGYLYASTGDRGGLATQTGTLRTPPPCSARSSESIRRGRAPGITRSPQTTRSWAQVVLTRSGATACVIHGASRSTA
jgi:glucose/arabinose dehydrogenase